MSGMGRFHLAVIGVVAAAALVFGPAWATATTTTTTTTTTTRPPRPGVYAPAVSPSTIDNRSGCGHSTSATISTGTTGKVDGVTFRVQVGDRTTSLSASGSGSRWMATLNGSAFGYDSGSGSVRATATGPSGTAESGSTSFTVADCRP
ncbi:MAG: hypothetical protein QOD57_1789 [Actinomycetota bacterium]|jgi:hypothetical protein|nr:hypothetical protein [Actinomycetota bacterium]